MFAALLEIDKRQSSLLGERGNIRWRHPLSLVTPLVPLSQDGNGMSRWRETRNSYPVNQLLNEERTRFCVWFWWFLLSIVAGTVYFVFGCHFSQITCGRAECSRLYPNVSFCHSIFFSLIIAFWLTHSDFEACSPDVISSVKTIKINQKRNEMVLQQRTALTLPFVGSSLVEKLPFFSVENETSSGMWIAPSSRSSTQVRVSFAVWSPLLEGHRTKGNRSPLLSGYAK